MMARSRLIVLLARTVGRQTSRLLLNGPKPATTVTNHGPDSSAENSQSGGRSDPSGRGQGIPTTATDQLKSTCDSTKNKDSTTSSHLVGISSSVNSSNQLVSKPKAIENSFSEGSKENPSTNFTNETNIRSSENLANQPNEQISITSNDKIDNPSNDRTLSATDKQSTSTIFEPESTASVKNEIGVGTLEPEQRPKGLLGYALSRYTWYITRLQQSLESEMPRTFRMFRIFSVGLKAFVSDFTGYVHVIVLLSFPSGRLEQLTLSQLELYHFMPHDMVKVFPLLAISAVPFGQNIGLPLGYLFPRRLLCRHFWDLQQTHDFSMMDLRARVLYARPVFRSVQAAVSGIRDLELRVRCQATCHQLGSGVHPTKAQVLALIPLFRDSPFAIHQITRRAHVRALIRLHGLSALPGKRSRLREHARWLLCHDRALLAAHKDTTDKGGETDFEEFWRETTQPVSDVDDSTASGLSELAMQNLSKQHVNSLKTSLLLRGINPVGLDSSAMLPLLAKWLTVTQHLTTEDASLVLHLPILLFYNHSTNMVLVSK